MWSTRAFLRGCERLKELGVSDDFEPGQRISRRFADLGYEEFLLVPGDKLISLFTGQTSELPGDHRRFFFLVPTVEEMIQMILRSDFDLRGIDLIDQREWEAVIEREGDRRAFRAGRIDEALLEALCFIKAK